MKNENNILKIESQNAYILMDQNDSLKKELEKYKSEDDSNQDQK